MKLLSFTLLALCIIGSVYGQVPVCTTRKCVKAGEVCGVTGNNTITGCGADSTCTAGSGPGIGVCVVPFRLGDVCASSDISGGSCESGTNCKTTSSPDNSVCALNSLPTTYLYAGEGCNDDKQCAISSPYGSDFNYDRCTGGKCRSIKNGDYCTNSKQHCNYNSAYCSRTNQCTKYISKGGACYYSDESAGGCGKDYDSTCVPNGLTGDAGTCQKFHSRKAGEFCRDYDDCKEGLFCRIRGGPGSRGICSEVEDTTTINKPCETSLDCTNENAGETCQCGQDGVRRCYPQVRPDGFHSARKNYLECYRKKGCEASGSGALGCIMDNCKSQYCKYNKVLGKSPTAGVSCQYEGICNSAFSLVASPVLALLAFIVVMAL